MPKREPDDASLKRLGGGRWQTRDARFTIEPQSGTWVVVDAEQTDDLGLPLVRGPFPSLTAAKAAIGEARSTQPAESPLAKRIAERDRRSSRTAGKHAPADVAAAAGEAKRGAAKAGRAGPRAHVPQRAESDEQAEPRWLSDLSPTVRRRARRQMGQLASAGAKDPEGLVRRDAVGGVPTVAGFAVQRRLEKLDNATAKEILDALADGRDDDLDVRWRLVDGEGRPIRVG
jgi:hypothetical protein